MKLRTFLLLFGYFAGCFGNFNVDTVDVKISINGTDANVELQGGKFMNTSKIPLKNFE